MDEKERKHLNKTIFDLVIIFSIVAAIALGYALWKDAKKSGWLYHDTLITVNSRNWTNGEYKDCTSLNATMPSKTYLDCSPSTLGDVREFKVRFYGLTYVEGRSELVVLNWKCRKNGDSDPTITCEMR